MSAGAYLVLKVTLDTLEVVVRVDVCVEVDPGGGGVGAEVALVHDPLLVGRQTELVLAAPALLFLAVLHVAVDRVAARRHDARRLGLGLCRVENAIVERLR